MGGGLAGRLFTLFLAVALLPLLISGALSTTAVSELADGFQRTHQAQATRQVSRQVLDRLLACKAALESMRSTAAFQRHLPTGHAEADLFVALADVRPHVLASAQSMSLLQAWEAAELVPADGRSRSDLAASTLPAQLRVQHYAGGARLLMAVGEGSVPDVVAEVNPAYVWAPVADSRDDGHWLVQDGVGHTLLSTSKEGAAETGGVVTSQTHLFLGAEFRAGDWVFWQTSPASRVQWQGWPLTGWLVLVGLATLLTIALISHLQIRRILAPLVQLIAGTRQLAAEGEVTPVAVQGGSEIGVLAEAFNHMAARIGSQLRELRGLAMIDQRILAGRPADELARDVLAQLAQHYPHARLLLCWLDGPASLRILCVSVPGSTDVTAHHLTMGPDTWRQYVHEVADVAWPQAHGAQYPWLPFVTAHGWSGGQVFPVRDGGTAVAQIVVETVATGSGDWTHVTALRDRLSVAYAARKREEEMAFRAVHDSLTGLANRYGLHEFMDRHLQASAAPSLAVLFLDLDRFKDVNDSLGHEAGDELLCMASERLQSCVGDGGLLARRGGDEFVLVQPDTDEAGARELAAKAVATLATPFIVRGRALVLGGSVGVALSPQHGVSRSELLRCADMAMYAAKAEGRGRFAVYAEALDAQTQERVRVQSELRRAIDGGELRAHYQPRVQAQGGQITSAEALVRWQHPERGLLMPGSFIAWAEESNLIEDLGNWMLDEVCRQVAEWRRAGLPLERVSVNVSPRQLASGQFPQRVRAALARHDVPPEAIELEVTESLLVGDAREVCAQLAELRTMGVMVALDDFGTGYSSLSILRQLPIDIMKVDRAFVKDLGRDDGALAVTQAIVAMAHALRLHLVAEGMETQEQAEILIQLGCHELQGFYYSRPLPPAEFVQRVSAS